MATKPKRDLTPFEEELVKATKLVRGYKQIAEANIVSLFWKNQDLMYSYSNLKLEDFSENLWKVYWQVAHDITFKEKKKLEEVTVGFYMEKHLKLRDKFEEYGGYSKIMDVGEYVKEENIEGYVNELQKWNVVIKLLKNKFPVQDKISDFVDMKVDDVYNEYNALLNHVFANAEYEVKSYSISEGLDELIDKLDEGVMVGLPYHNMPLLNKETSGRVIGNMDLIAALSNVGKSTIVRSLCIPAGLGHDEPLCIIINEENISKWKQEMLVYVANVVFKQDVQKFVVRDGKFTQETKEILVKSARWLEEKNKDNMIRLIPFHKYTTALACKVISKYAYLGYKYFIIDTLKLDSGKTGDNSWLQLQQSAVELADLIKGECLNVHLLFTYQLGKSSAKQRYLTQDSLGVSKGVIDVCATGLMVRNLFDDEYDGGKNALKVFRHEGKNGKTLVPVKLDKEKHYQIFFVVKNRAGSANKYQIVVEHDLSRNKLTEVGICTVPQDF